MRQRLRDLGFTIGELPTGVKNSITDVTGVKVGHITLKEDFPDNESIRTGITAIIPHEGNLFYEKVPAASFDLNGFGKTTGLVQVEELGTIESPIMLTNTFSIPAVTEGTLRYMLEQNPDIGEKDGTVNIVAAECNDSYLNDIRKLYIRPNHAIEAIKKASSDMVLEGAVGAGTGMSCLGFKGGIGSSSRIINTTSAIYTVGTLVLSNFGKPDELLVLGKPVGKMFNTGSGKMDDGSIIIVIATDAPFDARQLKRLAKRAALGLARTGSIAHHGSGDIIIAFSNGNRILHNSSSDLVPFSTISENGELIADFFQAVVESVEEAVLNSLFMAETTYGRKNRKMEGIPIDKVIKLLK